MRMSAEAGKFAPLDELEQRQVDAKNYKRKLKEQGLKLLQLQRVLSEQKRSVIVVLEGPDASGKGGAIKRLVERLDPRLVRVYSIIKPTAEENAHHYLWRFWNKMPAYGNMTIFDRSWYGRVLVERVEKFATEDEWQRAYREINELERTLLDDGAVLVKFYLHITKDEQLSRFKAREGDPLKHWKISDEDWRNRKKWSQHNAAAQEMFERTSTERAPWHVIGANYKWFARLKVLKTVVKALEKADVR
ncbi:MAG: AMP-polyphosphate phosphotransferase [Chthoniobacter sp.]|jgi:polyphosphate kinase 2 (PPK2 family)|nr:AMP-polyphosphate phosphotransferase [Chthoniobacter sp.]